MIATLIALASTTLAIVIADRIAERRERRRKRQ